MAAELIIAPEAEQDLADAYAFYELQRFGLGEEFLSCVESCVETIRRSPRLYPMIDGDHRRALIRRFPYSIFFDSVDNTVTVYCVFHNARDPQKWRRRLS